MPISKDELIFACGMSRSGTTLLSTILDSHSKISMGYELIPPELPGPSDLLKALDHGLKICKGDFSKCGQALRGDGTPKEGLFFTRCYRAGIDENDLKELLEQMRTNGLKSICTLRQRLEVAWLIALKSASLRKKKFYGFKLNIPSVGKAFNYFPKSKLIYILRDPRDVVASHFQRNFNRTIFQICKAWNNYIKSFEIFTGDYPEAGIIIRYEDVAINYEQVLPVMFKFLGLPVEKSVFEFYKSKAGVHIYGHPNSENLKKNFFSTSIGRWKRELGIKQIEEIENLCIENMDLYGYGITA
jgi:hypothetical protein